MREQFQRAFSDLTASAELVKNVRTNPDLLDENYDLTDLELRRLTAIVNEPGMECNCVLYRANRLAPIVINLPESCGALGDNLRTLLSEYWENNAQLGDNFWLEAYDFCEFVKARIEAGSIPASVLESIDREQDVVAEQLKQIYPEKYGKESRSR